MVYGQRWKPVLSMAGIGRRDGWQGIQGEDGTWRRYYFHTISDGTKGHMYRSGAAPDGGMVNENGEWVVDGAIQIKKGE